MTTSRFPLKGGSNESAARIIALIGVALLGVGALNGGAPAAKKARVDPAQLVREAGAEMAGGCSRCLKSAAEK